MSLHERLLKLFGLIDAATAPVPRGLSYRERVGLDRVRRARIDLAAAELANALAEATGVR